MPHADVADAIFLLKDGLAQLNSNDYLILASTFHSIHAIASRISPVPGSSGVETVEAETFKMTCLQTPTGAFRLAFSAVWDYAQAPRTCLSLKVD